MKLLRNSSFFLVMFILFYAVKSNSVESLRSPRNPSAIPKTNLLQRKLVVYPCTPFEFIYSNSVLADREVVSKLGLVSAGGEVKQFTFALLAGDTSIKDLSISIDDLVSSSGKKLKECSFDIRVVKVWSQDALHWEVFDSTETILVPEILLKDDRVIVDESRQENGFYNPPHVLNVDFGTNIPAHTIKQIWVNADIPPGTAPGHYKGSMNINSRQGVEPFSLPVDLEILPFDLPKAKKVYGIYYRFLLSNKKIGMQRNRELIAADLKEMKKVGFDAITIYDSVKSVEFIDILKEVGMDGPIIVMNNKSKKDIVNLKRIFDSQAVNVYFYGVDEPNTRQKKIEHVAISKKIHDANAKVMTAITVRVALFLKDHGEQLDWVNFPQIASSIKYLKKIGKGERERVADFITYYWQIYQENPTRNRFLTGYYLWSSGADGVFPYEYQGFPRGLPWSEDVWLSNKVIKKNGAMRKFRMWCLTYPSQEGPVSTLQWEGVRAGITDLRYLTLLEQRIELLQMSGQKVRARQLREVMNKIITNIAQFPLDISVRTNPYKLPVDFEIARRKIVDLILSTQ